MSRSGGYKCYNMSCHSCIGRTLCGELGDVALNCVDRIVSLKTNADCIRSMSDEELAKFLDNWLGWTSPGEKEILEYLHESAEEDNHA